MSRKLDVLSLIARSQAWSSKGGAADQTCLARVTELLNCSWGFFPKSGFKDQEAVSVLPGCMRLPPLQENVAEKGGD